MNLWLRTILLLIGFLSHVFANAPDQYLPLISAVESIPQYGYSDYSGGITCTGPSTVRLHYTATGPASVWGHFVNLGDYQAGVNKGNRQSFPGGATLADGTTKGIHIAANGVWVRFDAGMNGTSLTNRTFTIDASWSVEGSFCTLVTPTPTAMPTFAPTLAPTNPQILTNCNTAEDGMRYGGAGAVSLNSYGVAYGAVVTQKQCFAACGLSPTCAQAVYGKTSGACYPMDAYVSGSADADWASIRCNYTTNGLTNCNTAEDGKRYGTAGALNLSDYAVAYGAVVTQQQCFAACGLSPSCIQAVYSKPSGACYPMDAYVYGSADADWASIRCNYTPPPAPTSFPTTAPTSLPSSLPTPTPTPVPTRMPTSGVPSECFKDNWSECHVFQANKEEYGYTKRGDGVWVVCPDGQEPNFQRDTCQRCYENSAGENGKCHPCSEGYVPNNAKTSCISIPMYKQGTLYATWQYRCRAYEKILFTDWFWAAVGTAIAVAALGGGRLCHLHCRKQNQRLDAIKDNTSRIPYTSSTKTSSIPQALPVKNLDSKKVVV